MRSEQRRNECPRTGVIGFLWRALLGSSRKEDARLTFGFGVVDGNSVIGFLDEAGLSSMVNFLSRESKLSLGLTNEQRLLADVH